MGILLSGSNHGGFFELISVLLIFVFVLAITYYTTKWISGYQKVKQKNRNLKVIEMLPLANNNALAIIAAGKKYFVISICNKEIHYMCELSEDDFTDLSCLEDEAVMEHASFQEVLGKIKDKMVKK